MLRINYKITYITMLTALLFSPLSNAEPENKIFNKVCKSCHTGGFKGFMSGAPNISEKEAWQKYIEKHSYEEMKRIVIQGTDEHKVKGGCKKCSDEEIVGAIDFMLRRVGDQGGKQ